MTSSIYTSENVHQLFSINTWEDNACEREELFKSHLTGEQMRLTGHRPAQAGLRGFLTTWAVRFWNSFQQAKSPTAPCIVALPRRGLCHSWSIYSQIYAAVDPCSMCHKDGSCSLALWVSRLNHSQVMLQLLSQSLWCAPAFSHGRWIHPLAPASCRTETSCCSL